MMELIALIQASAQGNKQAMEDLLTLFSPLLRKYAKKLNYEDSYNDLCLAMVKLLRSQHLVNLRCMTESTTKAYINNAIKHEYQTLSIKYSEAKIESTISYPYGNSNESECNYSEEWDKLAFVYDTYWAVEIEFLESILTKREIDILLLATVGGYPVKQIAQKYLVSESAISQMKKRALRKLRTSIQSSAQLGVTIAQRNPMSMEDNYMEEKHDNRTGYGTNH
jgi:RNA polymerase sigma factor (sigma-70 family)